jgi:hypothetical protein
VAGASAGEFFTAVPPPFGKAFAAMALTSRSLR